MNAIIEKYNRRVDQINSLLCVGLDTDYMQIPERFRHKHAPQFAFNRWVIENTHACAAAYKPNLAFYEARGEQGWRELGLTMDYLHNEHPEILTICDGKRADIGSTNVGYVQGIFDTMGFDAVTLHPYLGQEALRPFLEREDKACIILCRTSNPGASELQDLQVGDKALWQVVAEKVRDEWNTRGNCMLVVGATYPAELARVRALVGEMTLLVPGLGAQGGDVEKTVRAGLNHDCKGLILNASRSIIYAEDPAQAAQTLRDTINRHRRI
ncbi:MAG: orotidine-5'-phosphate decarboxylase [Chloroflexi bacterium]|nr:orotidine-5'-phosphate decarboxylase [Chloroflexota bacterium]